MAQSPDQLVAEIEDARAEISRAGAMLVARLRHDLSPVEQVRDHYPVAVIAVFGIGLIVGLLHDD